MTQTDDGQTRRSGIVRSLGDSLDSHSHQVHVAIAERLYAALSAGDRSTLAEILHPDFTGHATEGLPLGLGGSYQGPEAMQRDFWWKIGRNYRAEAKAESFHTLDDGRLFVSGRYLGQGRASGRTLDAAFIHVLAISDDGRIVALEQLTDSAAWDEALGDALHTIDYSVADGVATVCLNRPEQRNAINARMAHETLVVARRIAADSRVRTVLICGNGPSLTVGGDITEFGDAAPGELGDLLAGMTTSFHEAFRVLSRIDAPIVTAANGAVAGGGLGFVYAADIVVVADDSRFVVAFSALGLSGDGGGTWHLPRLVGPRRAARLYLENRTLDAAEALEWGLVSEVVPAAELRDRAVGLAQQLAAGPTVAFGAMRRLLRQSWTNNLSDHLQAEIDELQLTGNSADAAGAVASFLRKRPPQFVGR
jgi:2-(1,2-epoxy-1,2-dihydrophenyl)acetyl-CoA isomerase